MKRFRLAKFNIICEGFFQVSAYFDKYDSVKVMIVITIVEQ